MKQIIQSLKTSQTILEDLPAPTLQPGAVLIQTARTLISANGGKTCARPNFGNTNSEWRIEHAEYRTALPSALNRQSECGMLNRNWYNRVTHPTTMIIRNGLLCVCHNHKGNRDEPQAGSYPGLGTGEEAV